MGGAFYALLNDRSFALQWHGIDHVFRTPGVEWMFDPRMLGLSSYPEDVAALEQNFVRNTKGNEIYAAFPGRHDIGIINDLNTRQITLPDRSSVIESYMHVFLHSNRGPTIEMYQNICRVYNWPYNTANPSADYLAAYRRVFDNMFQMSAEFLATPYKAVNRNVMPFSELLDIVRNNTYISMAYHHRVPDDVASRDDASGVISDDLVRQIVEVAESQRQGNRPINLFFLTNSASSAQKMWRSSLVQNCFARVFAQELLAPIHVNYITDVDGSGQGASNTADVAQEGILSLQQAMRDWIVMREAGILVCSNSGFCMTAAVLAAPEQRRYGRFAEGLMPVEDYAVFCMDRSC
jgi:hypothetical protein